MKDITLRIDKRIPPGMLFFHTPDDPGGDIIVASGSVVTVREVQRAIHEREAAQVLVGESSRDRPAVGERSEGQEEEEKENEESRLEEGAPDA